jgi:hypothetical protein
MPLEKQLYFSIAGDARIGSSIYYNVMLLGKGKKYNEFIGPF